MPYFNDTIKLFVSVTRPTIKPPKTAMQGGGFWSIYGGCNFFRCCEFRQRPFKYRCSGLDYSSYIVSQKSLDSSVRNLGISEARDGFEPSFDTSCAGRLYQFGHQASVRNSLIIPKTAPFVYISIIYLEAVIALPTRGRCVV